jgi:hypothetical protein
MKTTLIFLGIILIVKFLVKELSKPNNPKDILEDDHQIEDGYPTSTMRSLHINSTKVPTLSNLNYTKDQLNQFDEDYDQNEIHNKQIYTKNMFVESHYELNLSLFERDLTVKIVYDAYEKILNEHMDKITKGIPDIFNITEKQEARDYLLNKLNKETKS